MLALKKLKKNRTDKRNILSAGSWYVISSVRQFDTKPLATVILAYRLCQIWMCK